MIIIKEEFQIPGTDLILEKGDSILIKEAGSNLSIFDAIEKEMSDNKRNIDVKYLTSELRAIKNLLSDNETLPKNLEKIYKALIIKYNIKGDK